MSGLNHLYTYRRVLKFNVLDCIASGATVTVMTTKILCLRLGHLKSNEGPTFMEVLRRKFLLRMASFPCVSKIPNQIVEWD